MVGTPGGRAACTARTASARAAAHSPMCRLPTTIPAAPLFSMCWISTSICVDWAGWAWYSATPKSTIGAVFPSSSSSSSSASVSVLSFSVPCSPPPLGALWVVLVLMSALEVNSTPCFEALDTSS
eukprot:CAMPEP_0173194426 /NCGR_PEP_ID=MMETSP1141-20130122/14504_1 /TAXON_ID=483371 /ORGANISM="non described non described, Strain CCMP2298" /LENGTH=124 /DNA_ID=CAMNT_0014118865 /DNA_START=599 /DNA_END=973 /DNA_ORIENTATION=+